MTSEIRTNSLKSRAGLSTVTLTDSGPMFSGITTFVDNSGFNLGTGSSIFTPASNTLTFGTNSNERLRINSSGLVNIGAGSSASGLSPLLHLHKNASNDSAYLHITNNDTGITNNDGFVIGVNPPGDCLVFNKDSTPIRFATAGIERVRIDANGNMGLGDSAPPNFTGYRSLSIHGSTGGALVFGDDGTDEWEVYAGDGVFKVYDRANTSERLRITSGGDVLIADTTNTIYDDVTGGGMNLKANGQLVLKKQATSTADPLMWLNDTGQTTNKFILFAQDGNEKASIGLAGNDLRFARDGYNETLRIASDGVITAQKSASFGNTSDSFTAVNIVSSTSGISELRFADTTANPGYIKYTHSDDIMEFVSGTNNQLYLYGSSKEARFRGYVVAQSAGSGGSTTASFGATQSGMASNSYNYILSGSNDVGNRCVLFVNGSTRSADGGANTLTLRNDGGNLRLGNSSTSTNILGNLTLEQPIVNQQTKFQYSNSGGVGAYLSLFNTSTTAGSSTGISFGIGNSDAQLDGGDWGEGQIKVYTDSGGYGNMEFNCHTNANRSWLKIVGNGQGFNGASAGTESMRGGVAFGAAGLAIDRAWYGQPGIHVFNQNVEGDTDQGTLRFHGWDRSYASYPNNSGSDFGVSLVADGMNLTSDRRRKTDIATITGALDKVSQMRGVSFTYVNRDLEPQIHMSMDNGKKLGFIAQEVIPLLPQLIHDSGEKAVELENGYCDRYNMDYGGVTPLLVEAIKELKTKIENLEQDNIALRSRITNLEGE